jgi:diguanylate cyclase (GGDEF)-like protein/PAS domain S-box-containing protein
MSHRSKPRSRLDHERLAGSIRRLTRHRRDLLLEAIAKSGEQLLSKGEFRRAVPKVLELIGQAAAVDRVHIFVIDPSKPAEDGEIVEHYLWTTGLISTPPLFRDAKGHSFAEAGLKSWTPRLRKGEILAGHARTFEEHVRRFFESGDVKSTVAVPVLVEGSWWGLIAFDYCQCEREWLVTEIETLRILAELIGAAADRAANLQRLADANRIIEKSPTILYRLSSCEPFPLIYVSRNIARHGYSAEELLASPNAWRELIVSEDRPSAMADMKKIACGEIEHSRAEFRLKRADGSLAWFDGEATGRRDADGRLVAIEGALTDITERKFASEKLAELARSDSLTGLCNRAGFIDELSVAFARARRGGGFFAVVYLDLDHFKDVNDTLGHRVGDALLRLVADRLRACVRETDLVCRFGGDEFAILLDGVFEESAVEAVAHKISKAFASPFRLDGSQAHVAASMGAVLYGADIEGPEAMMMKADLALYRAKDDGGDKLRFHVAELDREVQERMLIGEDLRFAVERGEFELLYQPQVELQSGKIVGAEALIRWRHPTRGLLLPADFLPIAESTGAILPIGRWVIDEACRQIKLWRDAGVASPVVAVNVSSAQFMMSGDLHRVIVECLAKYGLGPSQLELELTESVLMKTTQDNKAIFERLRSLGVRLVIDDFGTGYSSLDCLRVFRVARLKIDRRFVDGVTSDPDDAIIVRAVINLAHELGVEVVAEGVETAEQQKFLLSAGCKIAQGYLFGKPMTVVAATEWFRRKL